MTEGRGELHPFGSRQDLIALGFVPDSVDAAIAAGDPTLLKSSASKEEIKRSWEEANERLCNSFAEQIEPGHFKRTLRVVRQASAWDFLLRRRAARREAARWN